MKESSHIVSMAILFCEIIMHIVWLKFPKFGAKKNSWHPREMRFNPRKVSLTLCYFELPMIIRIFTGRNSSCGKVMFSQACVKNSVQRGGILQDPPQPTPLEQTPTPGAHPPPEQPPSPRSRHPLPRTASAAAGAHPIRMHSCPYFF